MSITFNNGVGFGASGGGGTNPYGYGTWKLNMNVAESNTTGIIFAAQSFSNNNGPGYASGWTHVTNRLNGGANFWEYAYFSYTQFTTPQTNLSVEGTISFDALDNPDAKGLTIIGDALVGVGASPTLDNYDSFQESSTYNIQFSFTAADQTVIVISAGVESGGGSAVPRNITSINGLGLTWSLRKKYTDPNSNCGQQSEIWYAVNNTGDQVSGTITIIYNTDFDDQATIVTSWLGCNLSSPWTSSNPSTSNSNVAAPGPVTPTPTPTNTPTPTPSGVPLTQFTPNGTNGPNGLITWLDYTTGINASNHLIDQSPFNNEFSYTGSNPYTSGVTGYTFTGAGSYASALSVTQYNQIVNSFTIEMWVKIPSIPGTMSLLAAGGNSSGGWALRVDGSGNQLNFVKYNVADQSINLPSTLQNNTWYHIVVAQGGTSLTYMINGEIVGASNSGANNNLSIPNGTVNVAKDFYTGNNYGLVLGSLKVYDNCRSSADILSSFEASKTDYGFAGSTPTPTPTNTSTPTNTPTPTPSATSVLHPYQYQLISDTNATGTFGNNLSLACQGVDCHLNMTCSAQSYAPNVYFNNQTPSVGDNIYSDNNSNSSVSVTDGYYLLNDGNGGFTVVEIVSNQIASIPNCSDPTPTPTNTSTPTNTPTPSVTSTTTPTPTPTSTVTPTNTTTPTPSVTNTSTPTPTPSGTPSSASAPMVVTIYNSGSNVVMTSTGTINLSGLTLVNSNFGPIGQGGLGINTATFISGPNSAYSDTYSGFTSTPSNFGSGMGGANSSGSGQAFGIIVDQNPPYILVLPTGYTSGANISSTQTFNNTSLSTLGFTNGTYTYTWSGGSIDVIVGGPAPTPTPTPSTGAVTAGWNFYEASGNTVTVPPLSNGQILMYTTAGGPPISTYNPNAGASNYVMLYKKNSDGTDYTTQFTNLANNGGTINITQNGNTATYVATSGGQVALDPAGFLLISTALQTVTVASPFTYTDRITITIS